ncbi:MAG: gliding motility-associated C-terminal domain-containing protein [Bacteroidetes bacterium]|nr:gliding motility-associated C-terminal domain-containing protein [Bacteroidota bacterium]
MKNVIYSSVATETIFRSVILCLLFDTVGSTSSAQQQSSTNWSVEGIYQKSFIENKGQFNGNPSRQEVIYAVDHSQTMIYFHKNGVTYYLRERELKNKDRDEFIREAKIRQNMSPGEWLEFEKEEKKVKMKSDVVSMVWENANPAVNIVGSDKSDGYNSYTFIESGKEKNVNYINGFKKLTYKNLYPHIDVEYVFHPVDGIKYSLILHPGADISVVKMKYPERETVFLSNNGEVHISTIFGDIIDHAPQTFYSGNKEKTIESEFVKNNNIISFYLGNYNKATSVIIDPWTQTPTLANSNGVWECEVDGSGNVYIIGGDMPEKLVKYNSAGGFQWSYTTPWDTTNAWLGTLKTDISGNNYITKGSTSAIQKVDVSSAMLWSDPGSSQDEYWSITFNCDQTKLVVGGTTLSFFPPANSYGKIFDISTGNGSIIDERIVTRTRTYTILSFDVTDINEVRSVSSSYNARYYFLTLDTLGAIDDDLSACPSGVNMMGINHTYNFGYKSEYYRPNNGNSGICAVKANRYYVYTQNGATLHKRSLATGAILTTVAIPGGISTSIANTTPTLTQPGNSGIDIDSCGNVYVGSGNAVIKYDSSLNFITSVPTSYAVFDVAVNYNGEIIACGATGNSDSPSRTGYVQSINMSACAPMTLYCCNANICPADTFCDTDPATNLTAAVSGGTWSGTGITNSSLGTFDPGVAGPGTWTITYTMGCGSDSITIPVIICSSLSVCVENNGDLTVSNGTAPYTWESWTPASSTSITNQSQCQACGYSWFFGQCLDGITPVTQCITPGYWSVFGSGTTVTPPANDTLRVTDNFGNTYVINNVSSLPNCSGCALSVTAASSNATCGLNNGTATATAIGGTPPLTYSWSNSQTGSTATGLSATTYTVTVTDGGGCTDVASATVNITSMPVLSVASTPASCGSANGTATATVSGGSLPYTFSWSNSQTGSTATALSAATYTITVTDGSGCTVTGSTTVSGSSSVTVSLSPGNVTCNSGNDGTATATPAGGSLPYTFNWSNSQSGSVATTLAAGTYTVTVTDAAGCTATGNTTLTEPSALSLSVNKTDATCGSANGTATATVSGGTPSYSYLWTGGQTTSAATGLAVGTYTVTVTDGGGCTASSSAVINSSGGPSVGIATSNPSCNGGNNGTAVAAAGGGNPPYTYLWSNGQTNSNATGLSAGTYYLTVSDAAGCPTVDTTTVSEPTAISITINKTDATCGNTDGAANASASGGTGTLTYQWSTGASTQAVSNLGGGIYTVTVTDNKGCTNVQSTTILSTGGVTLTVSTLSDVSCNGGSDGVTTVSAVGGTPPYSFSWSNGQTNSVAVTLTSGSYTVSVTDANNCVTIDSAVVTEPTALITTMSAVDASCGGSDGSATVSVSGGTPSYSYNWSTGGTASTITGIPFGNYTVTVTDGNGCTITDVIGVNEAGAPSLTLASQQDVSCYGGSDGSASGTATGGNPPYTFVWSNGNPGASVDSLAAGNISLTVTDNAGCQAILNVTITEPPALSVATSSTDVTCTGGGTAAVAAAGGTPPYSYLWSNGNTTSVAVVSVSGSYTVTVTDGNGCTGTGVATVNQTDSITAAITGINEICAGEPVMLIATGGMIYYWNNSTTNDTLDIIPAVTDTYSVIAFSGICSDTAEFTVIVNPAVQVDAGNDTVIYIGESIELNADVTGGTPAFMYDWNTGADDPSISVSPASGTWYSVTVTDSKGCMAKDSVFVDIRPCDAEVFIPNAFAPGCKCADEKLHVFSDCIGTMTFRIFDRWGEKVFETEKITEGWDGTYNGKPMDAAVYVYHLKYSTINEPQKEVTVEGNVNLVR